MRGLVALRVWSDKEIAEAKVEADRDIAVADRFITIMSRGIREYEFFNPETERRVKIATLAQMIELSHGPEGAVVVAACAIELLAAELGPVT